MIEPKIILLAEDNLKDVELTLEAFGEYNLENEVVVAHDGTEALDYLCRRGRYADRRSGNPAVILLDIKMPKVTGLEVLRTIKGDPALKAVPVVMLTSSRKEQDLRDSYQLGVNAYVVKSVAFGQFVESVKQIVAFWTLINEPPPGSNKPR